MDDLDEGRLRDAFAWLRAHAADDTEAIDVLATYADLRQLAADSAAIALTFIAAYTEDVASHVDLMFRALEVAMTTNPDPEGA